LSSSDLTFFTNEKGHTLLDRFRATLKDTVLFDVLVGYFRSKAMINKGTIAKKVSQSLKREFEKTLDPLVMLAALRKHIRFVDENHNQDSQAKRRNREIVLSIYQQAESAK